MKRYLYAALAAAVLAPGLWAANVESQGRGRFGARIKAKLGLSDDQFAKVRDAVQARRKARARDAATLKESLAKLESQLEGQAKDEELASTLDSLKSQRRKMRDENERFVDDMAKLLTPTQRAKMVLALAKRLERRQGGRLDEEP